jgi:hypothetical protein
MNDGIFNNGIQQPVQLREVKPFDWLGYKAEVAKELIRPCYEEAKASARQSGGLRPAKYVAIEDAINMAVDMAERLEQRLKGGGK